VSTWTDERNATMTNMKLALIILISSLLFSVTLAEIYYPAWSSDLGDLQLVTLPNATFWVGNIHHKHCLINEREQVELFQSKLSQKRSNCTVVDVGMNDGFYSQMGGSFGCRVFSFELQSLCIEISRGAAKKNGIDHLLTITQAPVSASSGHSITMFFPERSICDGGFTFSGPLKNRNERLHSKMALTIPKNFTSVALSTFPLISGNVFIDLMKIDVEGHEAEVLEGALALLRQLRVGALVVELGPAGEYADPIKLINMYKQIVDMGYTLTTFNCRDYIKRGGPDVFASWNFVDFEKYFHFTPWPSLWRCPDLLIQHPNSRKAAF